MIGGFARFIGIDWSGAKSGYSRKIQVAVCTAGGDPPALVEQPGGWRRAAVLDWLLTQVLPGPPALIGFDFSFAPPYFDCGAYLPGHATADDGPGFWAHVESVCAAADLGAADFVTEHARRYFYLGAADGPKRRTCDCAHASVAITPRAAANPPAYLMRSAPLRSPRRALPACACCTACTRMSRSGRSSRISPG
ncbi:hypothetical protein [Hankyongella ginsenosidimutans]|uniref:hypothetical protein n=1 Tax=Hankyongella ginsenosidimutans TaxID=1763828 RepID=UPI00319DC449